MIKIKLSDPTNMKCFSGLLHAAPILSDYSMQLVTDGSYDYELLATNEFVKSDLPLQQSIDFGVENLASKSGDYFLVHGGDSTSLMAAWEVFNQSSAKYLFKKQILTREKYAEPSIIGKWFFGTGSELDKSYDLSTNQYNKLKLCGYNVGHNWPQLHQLYAVDYKNKSIDVAAVYQTWIDKPVYDHEVRTDGLYGEHRNNAWKELANLPYNIIAKQASPAETPFILNQSKIAISPFGMGELCYRDLESIQHGCIIIKPDMSHVITEPNLFIENETYIPCKVDYSDLSEIVERVLGNYKNYLYIAEQARARLVELYSYHHVAMHWYNFFANETGISNES